MGRRRGHVPHLRTVVRATVAASVVAALVPAIASAHRLGNFTINHFAGVRIEPDRILLDVIIDQAEIPAFQSRLTLDIDGDGQVSEDEIGTGRKVVCADPLTQPVTSRLPAHDTLAFVRQWKRVS